MLADFERLSAVLTAKCDRLAIAFSGGVDSVTLARAAEIALGKENLLLLMAVSEFTPSGEKAFALEWAAARKLTCEVVNIAPLAVPEIAVNDAKRCYYCKKYLLSQLQQTARNKGFTVLADGENLDDAADYRPGRQAAEELGIFHPLAEAALTKAAIRDLAHDFALPNSQAPASACLASRIPCGTALSAEALQKIDRAESALQTLGFSGVRVRYYGDLAKIEVPAEYMEQLWRCRSQVLGAVQAAGFKQTAVDLGGYRRGAVNGAPDQVKDEKYD